MNTNKFLGAKQSREDWMSIRIVVATAAVSALVLGSATLGSQAVTLDYDYYKTKVQPIFLTKRPGHARCVMCHAEANNMLKLQKLPAGQATWSEEDTRKNFETVSKIVEAVDDPMTAKILLHPLAPEAGGDAYHSGGRQFPNRNDPYWKTIADWAKGATLPPGKK
jgi:hypothetical protein